MKGAVVLSLGIGEECPLAFSRLFLPLPERSLFSLLLPQFSTLIIFALIMVVSGERHHGPAIFEGEPAVDAVLKQAWYDENVKSIPDDARRLLEEYSGLDPNEIIPHVVALRDKAFKIWSYACIGQMRFLTYNLSLLPFYRQVLTRIHSGATFLDAGCCFGQEIRYMVQDGVPSTQLYGFDLEPDFIELGYQLFRDRDKLQATFVSGDVLAGPTTPGGQEFIKLKGQMDIVFASSFLHVWDWEDMIKAAKCLVFMTRPQPGSMIIGKQLGSVNAGQYKMPTSSGFNYRHNAESMRRFWQQIGEETETSWKVEADVYQGHELTDNRNHAWSEPEMRMVWFTAVMQ